MMDQFFKQRKERIASNRSNQSLQDSKQKFLLESLYAGYSYNFSWLGIPIIQYPQDIVAIQEIIWETKPDLIIETGVAHGGSLILSASMLHLLDNGGQVIGIDIDIRSHNREAIETHPLYRYIHLIEGSSTDLQIVDQVKRIAADKNKVMVLLDSNHTHAHVFEELKAYAPLVSPGSYCVVYDTVIDDMPKGYFEDRPWDVGNNPKTAVAAFLQANPDFEIDESYDNKLLISVAPSGYLKRTK